jgi:hypothetical protein
LSEFSRFCELRQRVHNWAAPWGGTYAWHYQLDLEYQKADQENRVKEWIKKMLKHVGIGQDLLSALSSMQGHLPKNESQVRELWRLEVELLTMVTEGLAALEVRVNLLSYTVHGLLSNYQWPRDQEEEEEEEEEGGGSVGEQNDADGNEDESGGGSE